MKKIMKQVNGYDIEYVELGKQNSKTIVFAHGLGGHVEQWKEQLDYFSTNYHVVSFSLQGHGGSSKPEEYHHYTIEQYAKTITSLFEKLCISSCIWVGNSMGGVLGYELLKRSPEKIEMLFTNGTTPKLIMPRTAVRFITIIDHLLLKMMKINGYVRFATKHTSKSKSVQEKLFQIMRQTLPQAIIASHKILANYNYIETINNSRIPIIIIRAPYDLKDINKYLMKNHQMLEQNENVRFVDIEDAGHVANLDQPTKYNLLIEDQIKEYM